MRHSSLQQCRLLLIYLQANAPRRAFVLLDSGADYALGVSAANPSASSPVPSDPLAVLAGSQFICRFPLNVGRLVRAGVFLTDFAALFALSRAAAEQKTAPMLLELDLAACLGRVAGGGPPFPCPAPGGVRPALRGAKGLRVFPSNRADEALFRSTICCILHMAPGSYIETSRGHSRLQEFANTFLCDDVVELFSQAADFALLGKSSESVMRSL